MNSRPASSNVSADLDHVRRLARQLDTAIPLPGGMRIGWDAVLGLIPGLGDWAGALLSSYIILQAMRLGAPREVLLRMVGNVGLEALVGSVPFFGDVFDAAWKANVRNVRLLEDHLAAPRGTRRASRGRRQQNKRARASSRTTAPRTLPTMMAILRCRVFSESARESAVA